MNAHRDKTNAGPPSSGDDPRSPDAAVEKLLRKWGAEESIRRVGAPPPLWMDQPPPGTMSPWLRWGPLAAAAVLLVAAGGLFLASLSGLQARPEPADTRRVEIERIEDELAESKRQADRLGELVRQAESELRDRNARCFTADSKALKLTHDNLQLELALRKAGQRRTSIEADLRHKESLLADARRRLSDNEDDLADLRTRLSAAETLLASERTRLSAKEVELAKVRGMRDRAIAAERGTQERMLALKAGHRGRAAQFRGMHPSVAGEGGGSLVARQQASRRSGMLRRCAELRPGVRAGATGRLFDRLEVILTRLELLDARRPGSAGALAGLVGSGLAGRIDAALAGEPTAVQAWLIEAKMILAGANGV